MKKLYIISPKIKWQTFKLLQKKLVKSSGPTPQHADKVLWQMIRDKQILAWFARDIEGDMGVGRELPRHYKEKGWLLYEIK